MEVGKSGMKIIGYPIFTIGPLTLSLVYLYLSSRLEVRQATTQHVNSGIACTSICPLLVCWAC